jgi:hypothetical protein
MKNNYQIRKRLSSHFSTGGYYSATLLFGRLKIHSRENTVTRHAWRTSSRFPVSLENKIFFMPSRVSAHKTGPDDLAGRARSVMINDSVDKYQYSIDEPLFVPAFFKGCAKVAC